MPQIKTALSWLLAWAVLSEVLSRSESRWNTRSKILPVLPVSHRYLILLFIYMGTFHTRSHLPWSPGYLIRLVSGAFGNMFNVFGHVLKAIHQQFYPVIRWSPDWLVCINKKIFKKRYYTLLHAECAQLFIKIIFLALMDAEISSKSYIFFRHS